MNQTEPKIINLTCKEGHKSEIELDFTEQRYRFMHEPELWHSIEKIITNGVVSTTEQTPWCCSRQAYLEFMRQLKAMGKCLVRGGCSS